MNPKNSARLMLLITAAISGVASAAVLKVPQQYPTIQAAVDAAEGGDTVKIAPGTYTGNVRMAGKAVSLIGSGASETTLDAGGSGRAITVLYTYGAGPYHVTIANLTVRNGSVKYEDNEDFGPGWGGGLYAWASTVVLRDTVFTGNRGCRGMAVGAIATKLTMTRNRIHDNLRNGADCGSDAVAYVGGSEQSIFSFNVIEDHEAAGLVVYADEAGTLVRRNIFRRNRPDAVPDVDSEHGAFLGIGRLTLQDNLFVENLAYSGAGAMLVPSVEPTVVNGNSFVHNQSEAAETTLRLYSQMPGDFIVKNNLFDETGDAPLIRCEGEVLIDRSNVFASDPEAALAGHCQAVD